MGKPMGSSPRSRPDAGRPKAEESDCLTCVEDFEAERSWATIDATLMSDNKGPFTCLE
jgi:hypothetical protein